MTTHTLQFTTGYARERENGEETGIKGKSETETRTKTENEQQGTMYGVAAAILLVLPPGLMSQKCCIESKQG